MTPEAAAYLDKAWRCLSYGRINLNVELGNDAGRNAYLAAFHAAQAFVFDRTGKATKSHQGVHAEFNRLAKEEPAIGIDVRRFLSQAYNLKAVADYEMGPDSVVPPERAAAAVDSAQHFVDCIASLLSGNDSERPDPRS